MSGVVGEIKIVSVVSGNAVPCRRLVMIPSNETDRIAEVIAASCPAAGGTLIGGPGAIEGLRVTIGR